MPVPVCQAGGVRGAAAGPGNGRPDPPPGLSPRGEGHPVLLDAAGSSWRAMGSWTDLIPFYPKGGPRPEGLPRGVDVERALDVELHAHPSLETRRAENGELILRVRRQLHPAERWLARFVTVRPFRHVVLDRYGEFLLTEGTRPGVRLGQVAEAMAERFGIAPEQARLGVLRLVRELMVREFVFLVRREGSAGEGPAVGPGEVCHR